MHKQVYNTCINVFVLKQLQNITKYVKKIARGLTMGSS